MINFIKSVARELFVTKSLISLFRALRDSSEFTRDVLGVMESVPDRAPHNLVGIITFNTFYTFQLELLTAVSLRRDRHFKDLIVIFNRAIDLRILLACIRLKIRCVSIYSAKYRSHTLEIPKSRNLREFKSLEIYGVNFGIALLNDFSQNIEAFKRGVISNAAIRRALGMHVERSRNFRQLVDSEKFVDFVCIEINAHNRYLIDYIHARTEATVVQINQPFKDNAVLIRKVTKSNISESPNSVSRGLFKRDLDLKKYPSAESLLEGRYYGLVDKLQARNIASTEAGILSKSAAFVAERRYSTIFSHVLWDANLFYGEDLYEDYADWFVDTVRCATENDRTEWVIKLHPANIWKRRLLSESGELLEIELLRKAGLLHKLGHHIKLVLPNDGIDTFLLMKQSHTVVTVRGTAGIEAAALGCSVITAGTGRYSGFGFTKDFTSVRDYQRALVSLRPTCNIEEKRVSLACRYAVLLFHVRPLVLKSLTFDIIASNDTYVQKLKVAGSRLLCERDEFKALRDWYEYGEDLELAGSA